MIKLPDDELEKRWEQVLAAKRAFQRADEGEISQEDRVKRDRALGRGDHFNDDIFNPSGDDPLYGFVKIPINVIGSNTKIVTANLLHGDPKCSVEVLSDTYTETDPMTGQEVEVPWSEEEKKRLPILLAQWLEDYYAGSGATAAFRNLLQDGLAGGGVGILHAGWNEGTDDPTLPIDPVELERLQVLAQTPGVSAKDLKPAYGVAGRGPVALYVSPHDFLMDPYATWDRIEDAEYMGRVFTVPLDRLTRHFPEWSEKAGIVTDSYGFDSLDTNPLRQRQDPQDGTENVLLFDLWYKAVYIERDFMVRDGEETKTYPGGYEYPIRVVWAQDRPREPLRVELWPLDYRNERDERLYPFLFFIPNPQADAFWGQSDAQLQEAMQRLMNFTLSALTTHAKNYAKSKHTYPQNAFTDEGLKALLEGGPDSLIECVPNAGEQPIRPVDRLPPDPSILQVMETAKRFIDVISGVDETSQGIQAQGDQTATEANLLASKSGSRMGLKQQDCESVMEALFQRFYQALVQFQVIGDKVKSVLPTSKGGTGQPEEIEIEARHLVPAKVRIQTGSTLAGNRQQKIQNRMAFFNLAAQAGMLQPMNPNGLYNAEVLLDQLAIDLEVDDGSGALQDVSKFQQMYAEQQAQALAQQQQQTQQSQQHELAMAQAKGGAASQGQPQGGSQDAGSGEAGPDPEADPMGFYQSLSPEEQQNVHQMVLEGVQGGQNGAG